MARHKKPSVQTANPLTPSSVVGLKGGRRAAEKRHRRKRIKDRMASSVMIAVLMGVVAAAAYVGYTIYDEHHTNDEAERQQHYAEYQAELEGRTTGELIGQLEDTPRWNGPIAPGLGDGTVIEITPP